MQVLEFIFKDGWHFIGFWILLGTVTQIRLFTVNKCNCEEES